MIRRAALATALLGVVVAACSSGDDAPLAFDTTGTETPTGSGVASTGEGEPATTEGIEADERIVIDVSTAGAEISPLILGVSPVGLTTEDFRTAGLTLNSWGGNPASRYNYEIGNAWNHGADFEFRNTNYGTSTNAIDGFLQQSADAGAVSRVVVPTIGWIARNDDESTCSFPNGDACRPAAEVGNCRDQHVVADPEIANVESTPAAVAAWIQGLLADGRDIRFIAMDNEPELWGDTHYDIHPECPTYEEILATYLEYATAIRAVAPDAELTGPVMCCWYDYWRIAPGPADDGTQDFLQWFLEGVKAHDDETGTRTLDVVDVHFYPQTGVFNDDTDEDTNEKRLRSTRALWDPSYIDESFIADSIAFIPRLQATIEQAYPGLPLMISEWNFGAEETLNGALAIAEVLGIYGREGVYAAAYWRDPDVGSPGFLAFALHGNYDGAGSRFGGRTVPVSPGDGSAVSTFAAYDETDGMLRVMLINQDPETATSVALGLIGFSAADEGRRFTLGPDDETAIVAGSFDPAQAVTLPPSSITVLELAPAG